MADKDYPIQFTGAMVKALLAGQKSQTRRLASSPLGALEAGRTLAVRECWRAPVLLDKLSPSDLVARGLPRESVYYEASPNDDPAQGLPRAQAGRLRAAMHMPVVFSRMTLKLRDVRRQRLLDMSESAALAEGILGVDGIYAPAGAWRDGEDGKRLVMPEFAAQTAFEAFLKLWDRLHGKDGERARDDPMVVALSFEVDLAVRRDVGSLLECGSENPETLGDAK